MKVKKLFEDILEEAADFEKHTWTRKEKIIAKIKKYERKIRDIDNQVDDDERSSKKDKLIKFRKKINELNRKLNEEKEGEGEIPKDKEQKLIDFVKSHKNLDDDDFHKFAEKLGVDPHEAEEVIYRVLNKKLSEGFERDALYGRYEKIKKQIKYYEERIATLYKSKKDTKTNERIMVLKNRIAELKKLLTLLNLKNC